MYSFLGTFSALPDDGLNHHININDIVLIMFAEKKACHFIQNVSEWVLFAINE